MAESILQTAIDSKWWQLDGARVGWRAANVAAEAGAARGIARIVSEVN